MKTYYAWGLALLCAGCQASGPRLTAGQAMAKAVRLANAKSDALYQKHPFAAGKPPQFVSGRWVWTDIRGVGQLDLQSRVELAAAGSTNRVEIHLCAGGQASQPGSGFTDEQAMTKAVQLANAKGDALYQKHPFAAGKLAQFIDGRWVWTDMQGVGQMDLQARVELAADGSTNRVELNLLDGMMSQRLRFEEFPRWNGF